MHTTFSTIEYTSKVMVKNECIEIIETVEASDKITLSITSDKSFIIIKEDGKIPITEYVPRERVVKLIYSE